MTDNLSEFSMEPTSNTASLHDVESPPTYNSELDEVDKLSTNQNKSRDREMEEEEDIADTASHTSCEESTEMNAELRTAYKILTDLMADSKKAVNWPFMESIEDTEPELFHEYSRRIERPMWLKLMKTKFDENIYRSMTEFVSDFRLMLENCYRFNGPDHYISKRGQKLETMLEQKLALLSRELREKTSIEATSGVKNKITSPGLGMRRRQKTLIPHDSTNLLNQLREEEQQKVREWRKQQILDRKAEKEALAQEILDWEDKILFLGKYKEHMKAMWEIPQIGLFLFLCQGPLNIGEVMHFELERCFLIPRESSTMQLIMTSLLSTPFQRLKIEKKALMPYKIWENKLRLKLQQWYKVYADNDSDAEKTWLKLGIDGTFFEIVGQKNPLERKKFHEITFYKRVWIIKSLCDYCLHSQESLRETIEVQPFADQREYVLGTDAEGKRYIHFPQFCGADVRVYRQAPVKYPKIEISIDPFDNKRKFPLVYKAPPRKRIKLQKKKKKLKKQDKLTAQPSPSRQRPSRLRQSVKPVIPIQIGEAMDTDCDSSNDSEEESDNHKSDVDEKIDDNVESAADFVEKENKNDLIDINEDRGKKSLEDNDILSSGSDITVAYCDSSDTNSSYSSLDCSRESSPFLSSDLRLRQSAHFDKLNAASREASPLIYDSDYGQSHSRSKLRTPTFKASRNLTSFLIDENSTTSNSSAFGEPNVSGILTERLLNNVNLNLNSNSSETGEESNDCDIQNLFTSAGKKSADDTCSKVAIEFKDRNEHVKINEKESDERINETAIESGTENVKSDKVFDKNEDIENEKAMGKSIQHNVDEKLLHEETCELQSTDVNIPNKSHVPDVSGVTSELLDICQDKEDSVTNSIENQEESTTQSEDSTIGMPSVSDKSVHDTEISQSVDPVTKVCENEHSHGEEIQFHGNKDLLGTMKVEAKEVKMKEEFSDNYGELTELPGDMNLKENDAYLKDKIKEEPDLTDYNEIEMRNSEPTKLQVIEAAGDILDESKDQQVIHETVLQTNCKGDSSVSIKTEPETMQGGGFESEEEEEEERVPDIEEFELLADSVDEVRKLVEQFEEPEPIVIKKGKKEQITRPPPRKKCVVHLHSRLQFLLKELEPWESRLVQATKKARMRIRKEVEDYTEPVEAEDSRWNSTDEETESGNSDEETEKQTKKGEDKKERGDAVGKVLANSLIGKQSRETSSGSSTPVKLEDQDEIDVSKRGRLRKRRIIPNNAEDQIAPKKPKPKVETDFKTDTPSGSQPIIIQSGESQMVDYSDILRQLRNVNSTGTLPPGVNPVLIKSTQGGRTLLTSVLPLNTSDTSANSVNQKLQNIRLISPFALHQQLSGQNVSLSHSLIGASSSIISTKVSHHPTIQNLLTGNANTTLSHGNGVPISSTPRSSFQILPHQSIQNESVKLAPMQHGKTTLLTPVKTNYPGTVMISPETSTNQNQTKTQKLVLTQNTTPRKIAPHPGASTAPSSKKTVKYYAANASTLPINVVQQLLATRGAKLQSGPNQQSILYIPMENDGVSRNLAPPPGKNVTDSSESQSILTSSNSEMTVSTTDTNSHVSVSASTHLPTVVSSIKSKSPVTSNMLILPKPQTMQSAGPVISVSPPPGSVSRQVQQGNNLTPAKQNQVTSAGISKTVKSIFQSRIATGGIALNPTSPPRYPTNETVRTLLDKRKSVDDKVAITPKVSGDIKYTTYTCIASQLQRPCPSSMTSSVILKKIAASADANTSSSVNMALSGFKTFNKDFVQNENIVRTTSPQQHLLTSISPAKLNTILLQTSAAGAKSIPSLIKLPSKAVLDSAVKAVVTSVNTTLPTVNIKVPSPTSLPSIGPRRNVTKTIQTMKSPIPVAPKVVTQNSGRTSLSVADSHSVISTQSTVVASSVMDNSVPMNSLQIQAQVQAIVQGTDGKKSLQKIPTQSMSNSEPVVQVNYVTPQSYVIPKLEGSTGNQSATAILNQLGLQSQIKQELTGDQSRSDVQLVLNTDGLLQLVPNVGLQTQVPTSKATLMQVGNQSNTTLVAAHQVKKTIGNKQLVAVNAQGKHIIVKQRIPSTPSQVSSDPSTTLPKSSSGVLIPPAVVYSQPLNIAPAVKPAIINQTLDMRSPSTKLLLSQTATGCLKQVQPQVVTQAACSPLLNVPQALIPEGGFQLASPVISPVNLNLLQNSGPLQSTPVVQPSQIINIQTSLNSTAVKQDGYINQTLLNQSLLSNIGQHQVKVSTASCQSHGIAVKPTILSSRNMVDKSTLLLKESHVNQSGNTSVLSVSSGEHFNFTTQPNQLTGSSESTKGFLVPSNSLSIPIMSTNTPAKPLVFQYAMPSQGLVSPTLKESLTLQTLTTSAITNTTICSDKPAPRHLFLNTRAHVAQSSQISKSSENVMVNVSQTAGNLASKCSPNDSQSMDSTAGDQTVTEKANQSQKLLLYSIGGQLVTGQGVPVTLHQGILKVMPQGKLQIANQTLTSEQIKQTLAKIGNATVNPVTYPPVTNQPVTCTPLTNQPVTCTPLTNQPVTCPQLTNQPVTCPPLTNQHVGSNSCETTLSMSDPNSAAIVQSNVPTQTYSTDKPPIPVSTMITDVSVMDHAYQHKQKTGNMPARVKRVVSTVKDTNIKQEPDDNTSKADIVLKGAKCNSVYIMKPMTYSSGYTVFPTTIKSDELQSSLPIPVVREVETTSKDGKGQVTGQTRVQFPQMQNFVKLPVLNSNLNEKNGNVAIGGHKNNSVVNSSSDANTSIADTNDDDHDDSDDENDDDEDGDHLVIDDSASEKEAALNLLTLANQAVGSEGVNFKNK